MSKLFSLLAWNLLDYRVCYQGSKKPNILLLFQGVSKDIRCPALCQALSRIFVLAMSFTIEVFDPLIYPRQYQ